MAAETAEEAAAAEEEAEDELASLPGDKRDNGGDEDENDPHHDDEQPSDEDHDLDDEPAAEPEPIPRHPWGSEFLLLEYRRGAKPAPVTRETVKNGLPVLICARHGLMGLRRDLAEAEGRPASLIDEEAGKASADALAPQFIGFKDSGTLFTIQYPTSKTLFTIENVSNQGFSLRTDAGQYLCVSERHLSTTLSPTTNACTFRFIFVRTRAIRLAMPPRPSHRLSRPRRPGSGPQVLANHHPGGSMHIKPASVQVLGSDDEDDDDTTAASDDELEGIGSLVLTSRPAAAGVWRYTQLPHSPLSFSLQSNVLRTYFAAAADVATHHTVATTATVATPHGTFGASVHPGDNVPNVHVDPAPDAAASHETTTSASASTSAPHPFDGLSGPSVSDIANSHPHDLWSSQPMPGSSAAHHADVDAAGIVPPAHADVDAAHYYSVADLHAAGSEMHYMDAHQYHHDPSMYDAMHHDQYNPASSVHF
ncbi:hypothetical protein AMAG_17531 [Allomyces macrogynus ATCC 38327]|uniref:Uncharacterized protein n=1 Tax=Allomyces macrogynus (strain ATCC 38327) TaxID=578462 RepID=A0A0L0TFF7_ALLM3|nr:hypothetical protein AMAG_17531 [Allomyces macrogynus ATCC 38327]|eukprot:KNE73416.1 hypothetical protein AMAG_17531 [Allomyces macrogynus ATCC 38327]